MENQFIQDIASAMTGELTHMPPKRAVDGLTPEVARKRPPNLGRSCWEVLYHVVFWQDVFIQNLDGKTMDWFPPHDKNWPTEDLLSDDKEFEALVRRFNENIALAIEKLQTIDFSERIKIGEPLPPDATKFRVALVFFQHMAYHLAQIVTTRKALGNWKGRHG
ncbi:DinB family protein [Candidatus Hydrogenedentota bacterium]